MFDTITGLLRDKAIPGSALLAIAFAEYGADCFDWEPRILTLELNEDFGVELTEAQSDKLQASITVISTEDFETNWHVFNTVVHCLNSEPIDAETFDPVDAEQIAAALPEIEVIRNQFVEGGTKFDDEVNAYVGVILREYGLFNAPSIFPTAILPPLVGEHFKDSQDEKQAALDEIYTAKKNKIVEYLDRVKNCYTT